MHKSEFTAAEWQRITDYYNRLLRDLDSVLRCRQDLLKDSRDEIEKAIPMIEEMSRRANHNNN